MKLAGYLTTVRRYRASIFITTALLVMMGVFSLFRMPSAIYPEMEFPRIVVVAKNGDAPADVFVATVTRPLETALSSVLGLSRIRSRTIRGGTEISLDFSEDTDGWRALDLVNAEVSDARADLPEGTEIHVERITGGSFPVVTFNLGGPVDPRVLREAADQVVRPAFAAVPGVGPIDVVGGDERELEVIVDPEKLARAGISADGVATKLQGTMGKTAVGRVDEFGKSATVVSDAEPVQAADVGEIPIATGDSGSSLPLRSIAEVFEGRAERQTSVGGPGGDAVAISVARLPAGSTPELVSELEKTAKLLAPSLPPGATLTPIYDQALLVNDSLASVRDAILIGIVLCLVVVSVFLRDPRAGLVISISIPLTLGITFLAMKLFHQTLNLMSLGGMAVAIGLAIDDAIVVVEAISSKQAEGRSREEAAALGTAELATAVFGTTLTTVVVFVPLAFLDGVVGVFFRALAFTVVTAVLLSMVVSLVVIPLVATSWLPAKKSAAAPSLRSARFFGWLVPRKWSALGALALLLALGAVVYPRLTTGFLPPMDEGAFVLDYFLPAGSSLEHTAETARKIEQALQTVPEVATFARRTGAELGPATATMRSRGDIMVRLVPRGRRSRSVDEVIADLRKKVAEEVPEARVEFAQVLKDVLDDLAGNPRPIEVKLFGTDARQLSELAPEIKEKIEKVDGLVDLFDGEEQPTRELRFRVRRDALARFDLAPPVFEAELRTALQGRVVGQMRRGDRFVDVRLRFPDPVRFDPIQVRDLPLVAGGKITSFAAVSDLEETLEPSVRYHEALQPVASITADHQGRDLGAISTDIEAKLASLKLPRGVRLSIAGEAEAERRTRRSLLFVGGAALLLVLGVLAAQFRRIRLAFLVLLSAPVALAGGILALFVTGTALDASSMMGFVLSVGLVVKNGVLLLENAEQLLEEGGTASDAVIGAASRRLRPILMTTAATIAGLLPLALGIGAGAEIQRPLAIAVLGGLTFSTVFSLVLLPALATAVLGKQRSEKIDPSVEPTGT